MRIKNWDPVFFLKKNKEFDLLQCANSFVRYCFRLMGTLHSLELVRRVTRDCSSASFFKKITVVFSIMYAI